MAATRFADIHHREMAKWVGRESVLGFTVPHLGVTWGDTVNLAALDPGVKGVREAPPHTQFTPFDPAGYEELGEVPQMHLDYLLEQQDAGVPALGVFVRHVLVAGAIDVVDLERTRLA